MSAVFALFAAACWGSSDFAAGYVSRRASAVSVVVLTHAASMLTLLVLAVEIGGAGLVGWRGSPATTDLAWGLTAGVGGGVGAMLLFRGLGRASMVVVAPITAAGAAIIPAVFGVALGESLEARALLGVALALVAIVLISLTSDAEPVPEHLQPDGAARSGPRGSTAVIASRGSKLSRGGLAVLARPGVTDAIFSGIGFGAFFVCISRADASAGFSPLVAARLVSVALFLLVAVRSVDPVLPPRGARIPVVVAGLLDAGAAAFFVLATRSGLLSIGAVLASLYPAATILLARVVAQERVHRRQAGGLAIAGVAIALLAA